VTGVASPGRLRLQVFSTSWRFHPPRAWWPCFMPHPLMGLCPPELCSSRAAVRCLQRRYPHDVSTNPTAEPPAPNPTAETAGDKTSIWNGPGSALASRVLLHARVRHPWRRRLDRHRARSSPGLCALQGFSPAEMARPSPPLPSWAWPARTRTADWAALQGLTSSGIGSSLSRPPTLLGFVAS
jgi:hypothetical protein